MRPIHPIRLLTAASASVALLAGCGGNSVTSAGGTSAAPATSASSAASSSARRTAPPDNGVANLPPKEILGRARASLTRARSVHIKGGGFSAGEQFALDMRFAREGATGSLTSNGQTIELLRIGKTVYLKGSAAFWRNIGGSAAAELLKGKYLKVPASTQNFAELAGFTDLSKSSQDLLSPSGTVTKGGRKTIGGIEAVGLVDSAKDGGTLYIALRGEPYPLLVEPNKGGTSDQSGSLEFLDYGMPVPLSPPSANQVVDVSKLGTR